MATEQKRRPAAGKTGARPTTRQATGKKPATKRRTVKKEEPKISADVVYLPPKPFNRNRLVLRLITVVAVVLAVFFSLAVYFKVGETVAENGTIVNIEVTGEDKYTEAEIIGASGIKAGDHLIFLGRTKVAGKIISALPYIKSVRIGIKLPDKVMIQVEEVDVTYAVQAQDESWWLMSADGKIVEQALDGRHSRYTKIQGVALSNPFVGQQANAWQDTTPPTDASGNAIPMTVTAADRLKAAISITGFLEQNKIIGKVSTVDVSSLMDIQLRYGNEYQILLGSTEQLGVKIATMKAALEQVEYDEGVLDIRDPDNVLVREFT